MAKLRNITYAEYKRMYNSLKPADYGLVLFPPKNDCGVDNPDTMGNREIALILAYSETLGTPERRYEFAMKLGAKIEERRLQIKIEAAANRDRTFRAVWHY